MSKNIISMDLLKINVFWNKGYDVIISVSDLTKKILSYESDYIVNVIMWPKFGNSIISMREIIIYIYQPSKSLQILWTWLFINFFSFYVFINNFKRRNSHILAVIYFISVEKRPRSILKDFQCQIWTSV